ncbi:uncharacterized protein SAPINGB_P002415 [Magnusiomyces paraingens]|uniref:Uncharacterized protein n=1 Tax=Magnusiomyces paraingens TaxID=2606893 RepID=A0A5E8BFW0_9ASCO|nr:uncharacterized protein SAPINGB_P002415 [Saprochaete ingens]VVT49731.1 unnamed protein product [Saprochaete ingens]
MTRITRSKIKSNPDLENSLTPPLLPFTRKRRRRNEIESSATQTSDTVGSLASTQIPATPASISSSGPTKIPITPTSNAESSTESLPTKNLGFIDLTGDMNVRKATSLNLNMPHSLQQSLGKAVFIEMPTGTPFLSELSLNDMVDVAGDKLTNFSILWVFAACIALEKKKNPSNMELFFNKNCIVSSNANDSLLYFFPSFSYTNNNNDFGTYLGNTFQQSSWFKSFRTGNSNQEFGLFLPINYIEHWSLVFVYCRPIDSCFKVFVIDSLYSSQESFFEKASQKSQHFDLEAFISNLNLLRQNLYPSSDFTTDTASPSKLLCFEDLKFKKLHVQNDDRSCGVQMALNATCICGAYLSSDGILTWLQSEPSLPQYYGDDLLEFRVLIGYEIAKNPSLMPFPGKKNTRNTSVNYLGELELTSEFKNYFTTTYEEASAAHFVRRNVLMFFDRLNHQKNERVRSNYNIHAEVSPSTESCPYWPDRFKFETALINLDYFNLYPNLSNIIQEGKKEEENMWREIVNKELHIPSFELICDFIERPSKDNYLAIYDHCINLIPEESFSLNFPKGIDPFSIKMLLSYLPRAFSDYKITREAGRYKKQILLVKKRNHLENSSVNHSSFLEKKTKGKPNTQILVPSHMISILQDYSKKGEIKGAAQSWDTFIATRLNKEYYHFSKKLVRYIFSNRSLNQINDETTSSSSSSSFNSELETVVGTTEENTTI